ncbi:hypothetical protein D3C72_491740 [compost metagenome]
MFALVAAMEEEVLLLGPQQRQVGHVAMETFHQRQQQTLELAKHALDRGFIEVALVVGQVQAQVIPRIAHGRQREVGVGPARIRGRVEALRTVQHRDFHRGVFEHEQAVEQRLAFRQFALFLDVHQRQVFVLAQLHVAVEQTTEPLTHAAALIVLRHFHPQRDAVDEQADSSLHFRHVHRAPGHGHTEEHVTIAAQAPQDQGPRRLGEGVDGQLMGLRQFPQTRPVLDFEAGVAVADDHAAAFTGMFTQEWTVARDRRGALKPLQIVLPPLPRLGQALTLQPANVITITRRHGELRFTVLTQCGVNLEEVVHQQRAAPGIDEDVVVAHHEPVTRRAHTDQTQVERRLVEQIEPRLAFGLEQGLQLRLLLGFGEIAPVEVFDRRAARFVDHLQHVFADVPAKRRAQRFVAGDHRLPGLGETLRVEFAVDAVAILHVVQAGARFQQGVQQHAFLHRRQRVDVFDHDGRNRQRIQLRLVESGQREVRRRQATGIVAQTMFDQALQLAEVGVRKVRDGLRIMALGAEGPAQDQLTAVDLTVDAELVGQRRIQIMGRAYGFIQRMEQGIATKTLIELTEVVEGNRCHRQCGHALATQVIGKISQHAITQTFMRHGAQLLLDRLDRRALPGRFFNVRRRQAQRVSAGEPADGAGQVDLVEQGFAAMTLQLNQRRRLTAPAAQHSGQRRQQQVIDLGAIGRRSLLQ